MKIVVVGTGYVGLVTGTCFAETGHDVICVDTDAAKITGLEKGVIPIYEPGLEDLVLRNTKSRRLSFTTDTARAVDGAEVVFICVGTPPGATGASDLSAFYKVAEQIAAALTGPCLLVTKSTVPVGTGRKLWNVLQQKVTTPFDVASNPEFLKEGDAINDFMKPDRVVVGCHSEEARRVMRSLYEPFVRTDNPILFMDIESAELTKYAANAFLATRISFMNEMSALAQALGADIDTVRKGIGFDRRIGHQFMFPGVGYGGSCFPKDVQSLLAVGAELSVQTPVLAAVEDVNARQKRLLCDLLEKRMDPKGKTIALWGLAFKPRTDDIREAPALVLIDRLLALGAKVRVTDPAALAHGRKLYGDRVEMLDDAYALLEGADAWMLVTEWQEFRRPDFVRIKKAMRGNLVLDGRNIYDPEALRGLGFEYVGIGRR